MLIDKSKRLFGLLATCTLNIGKIRDEVYQRVYGDKETFWLGFEAAQEGYIFNPSYPGAIGVSTRADDKETICSRQLLHAIDNEPVWLNGGLAINKDVSESPPATLKDWVVEPGHWKLIDNGACLIKDSKHTVSKSFELRVLQMGGILTSERPLTVHFKDEAKTLGQNIRLFTESHKSLRKPFEINSGQDIHQVGSSSDTHTSNSLFDWIKPRFESIIQMRNSFSGVGIVISVSNDNIDTAVASMKVIRDVLKCDLPFEIMYKNEDDLSIENRKRLESVPLTKTTNIFSVFQIFESIKENGGRSIKPFALLASSFQKVSLY